MFSKTHQFLVCSTCFSRLCPPLADLLFEGFTKGVHCAIWDAQGTMCPCCLMYSQAKFPQTGKRSSYTSVALGACFFENPGLIRLDRILYSWLYCPSGLCNSVVLCRLTSSPTGVSPESSIAGCERNFNHIITLEQLTHLEWYLKKITKIPNQTKKRMFQ